jgi:hypothetical protein
MCDSCGCGDPHKVAVDVQERILSVNDRAAGHNREHFTAAGVLAVNLMGSPGAGKTAVLEATARLVPFSARSGAGMTEWIAWLEARRAALERSAAAHAQPHSHPHA